MSPLLRHARKVFVKLLNVSLSISNIPRGVRACVGHILETVVMVGNLSSNEWTKIGEVLAKQKVVI